MTGFGWIRGNLRFNQLMCGTIRMQDEFLARISLAIN